MAVVSPFLDRRHGTERCIVEQVERFARVAGWEIHLYCQRVEDLDAVVRYPANSCSGRILWHKVPAIPAPHLVAYLWWLFANHLMRLWDSRIRRLKFDLVYSPGINAFDADVISIHIVFREFYRRVGPRVRFREAPLSAWPVILHRHLYYRLMCLLEGITYRRKQIGLTVISQLSLNYISAFFGRDDARLIRYGVDTRTFHPEVRLARRPAARSSFGIGPSEFCLLLIGNDWKVKGVDTLLRAVWECRNPSLVVLIVGSDDRRGYAEAIRALQLEDRVHFADISSDVLQFYAAADAYVGPSLQDAYGLPILEAMACGLPVIASVRAGASEILRDSENGLLLRNPENEHELAVLLCRLYDDTSLRAALGEEAARTASEQTWDCNAAQTMEFLEAALDHKRSLA